MKSHIELLGERNGKEYARLVLEAPELCKAIRRGESGLRRLVEQLLCQDYGDHRLFQLLVDDCLKSFYAAIATKLESTIPGGTRLGVLIDNTSLNEAEKVMSGGLGAGRTTYWVGEGDAT